MRLSVLVPAAVAAAVVPGVAALAGPLTDWNLIVRTNLTSSSEVDGSAIVGGHVSGTSNYAVQGVTAPNNVGLAVGGNINPNGVSINSGGNLRIGGSVNGFRNLNGGGSQIADSGITAQVGAIFASLASTSAFLNTLAPNGAIDPAGNMTANPVLMGGQRVAVYSFNQAAIQSLGQLNLNFGAADSVIINVSASPGGVADFIAPPNLIGQFDQAHSARILWNFSSTSSILVNNTFNGSIIAPDADLQVLGGAVNGSVAVNSVSAQNAEIRRFNYTGFIPAPGASALGLVAGLALGRRRRCATPARLTWPRC